MSSRISASRLVVLVALLALLGATMWSPAEAKFLRRSRYFDETLGGGAYDSPYGVETGERAIVTVRGARNPYDGSAPSRITIEDQPYRGPYPRGVYDRLDSNYGRRPMYPDMGYMGGYNGGYGAGSMYGAPNRIAVTAAYPYGYGSRFGK